MAGPQISIFVEKVAYETKISVYKNSRIWDKYDLGFVVLKYFNVNIEF